jgi:hypothetical protein
MRQTCWARKRYQLFGVVGLDVLVSVLQPLQEAVRDRQAEPDKEGGAAVDADLHAGLALGCATALDGAGGPPQT